MIHWRMLGGRGWSLYEAPEIAPCIDVSDGKMAQTASGSKQTGEDVRRFLLITICLFGLMSAPATAMACPMCQVANENANDERPRAYMYSILFMLAMPATVLTGFGIGFYRLSKRPFDPADFENRRGQSDLRM